jgi:hypothetical protein
MCVYIHSPRRAAANEDDVALRISQNGGEKNLFSAAISIFN